MLLVVAVEDVVLDEMLLLEVVVLVVVLVLVLALVLELVLEVVVVLVVVVVVEGDQLNVVFAEMTPPDAPQVAFTV